MVDTLPISPAPIVVATPNGLTSTCTGAAATAVAGSGVVTLPSGAVIPAGGCVITVNVVGTVEGSYTNTIPAGAVIADKGYDSDPFVGAIQTTGAKAIIPPRSNRRTPREYDRERYKARNLVERFFNRLKQFRRLATRYDKLARRFNAFLHLACAYIWLL